MSEPTTFDKFDDIPMPLDMGAIFWAGKPREPVSGEDPQGKYFEDGKLSLASLYETIRPQAIEWDIPATLAQAPPVFSHIDAGGGTPNRFTISEDGRIITFVVPDGETLLGGAAAIPDVVGKKWFVLKPSDNFNCIIAFPNATGDGLEYISISNNEWNAFETTDYPLSPGQSLLIELDEEENTVAVRTSTHSVAAVSMFTAKPSGFIIGARPAGTYTLEISTDVNDLDGMSITEDFTPLSIPALGVPEEASRGDFLRVVEPGLGMMLNDLFYVVDPQNNIAVKINDNPAIIDWDMQSTIATVPATLNRPQTPLLPADYPEAVFFDNNTKMSPPESLFGEVIGELVYTMPVSGKHGFVYQQQKPSDDDVFLHVGFYDKETMGELGWISIGEGMLMLGNSEGAQPVFSVPNDVKVFVGIDVDAETITFAVPGEEPETFPVPDIASASIYTLIFQTSANPLTGDEWVMASTNLADWDGANVLEGYTPITQQMGSQLPSEVYDGALVRVTVEGTYQGVTYSPGVVFIYDQPSNRFLFISQGGGVISERISVTLNSESPPGEIARVIDHYKQFTFVSGADLTILIDNNDTATFDKYTVTQEDRYDFVGDYSWLNIRPLYSEGIIDVDGSTFNLGEEEGRLFSFGRASFSTSGFQPTERVTDIKEATQFGQLSGRWMVADVSVATPRILVDNTVYFSTLGEFDALSSEYEFVEFIGIPWRMTDASIIIAAVGLLFVNDAGFSQQSRLSTISPLFGITRVHAATVRLTGSNSVQLSGRGVPETINVIVEQTQLPPKAQWRHANLRLNVSVLSAEKVSMTIGSTQTFAPAMAGIINLSYGNDLNHVPELAVIANQQSSFNDLTFRLENDFFRNTDVNSDTFSFNQKGRYAIQGEGRILVPVDELPYGGPITTIGVQGPDVEVTTDSCIAKYVEIDGETITPVDPPSDWIFSYSSWRFAGEFLRSGPMPFNVMAPSGSILKTANYEELNIPEGLSVDAVIYPYNGYVPGNQAGLPVAEAGWLEVIVRLTATSADMPDVPTCMQRYTSSVDDAVYVRSINRVGFTNTPNPWKLLAVNAD